MQNARNVGNIERKTRAKQWLLRIQLKGVKFCRELENEDRFYLHSSHSREALWAVRKVTPLKCQSTYYRDCFSPGERFMVTLTFLVTGSN